MQRSKRLQFLVITLGLTAPLTAARSSAEEFPPCGTFTLWGGKHHVTPIEHGKLGDSVGDERIGERKLMDSAGSVVGIFRWVSHIVDVDEGDGNDDVALNQNVYTLPNGTIHADGQLVFNNAMDPSTQPLNRNAIAVVGGTGAYVRSEGEVSASFQPGKPSKYEFRLYCD